MTDIIRYRGDTAADQITVQTPAGAALDVTGFSFILSVNSLESPPTTATELYTINGIIIDAAGGVVEFVPSPAQADQKPAEYYYDIQMTDDITRIKTIEYGKYTYVQDRTK